MKPVVFLGPTLARVEATRVLDAVYLPPVQQGDVLRALDRSPPLIAIVDGYFATVPAVWHKEILTALEAGVPVLGAASMGALRAAELWTFGMEGVGQVFEWYRDGRFEDDDEVAVAHGAAEDGYPRLSDAMVDIRDVCDAAAAAGVVSGATAAALVDGAKRLFYPSRSFRAALDAVRAAGSDGAELDAFDAFRRHHGPAVKERDARQLLAVVANRVGGDGSRPVVDPPVRTERTVFLEALEHEVATAQAAGLDTLPSDPHAVLRTGESLEVLRKKVLFRLLARDEASRRHLRVTEHDLQTAVDDFRRRFGLVRLDDALAWMQAEGVSEAALVRVLRDGVLVERLGDLLAHRVGAELADQLRVSTAAGWRRPTVQDGGDETAAPLGDRVLAAVEALRPVVEAAPSGPGWRVSQEVVTALERSRLLRLAWPVEVGGLDAAPEVVVAAVEALSALDVGAGRALASTTRLAGLVTACAPGEAVETLLAAGDPIVGGQLAPLGRAATVPGGVRVEGRWCHGAAVAGARWVVSGAWLDDGTGDDGTGDDGTGAHGARGDRVGLVVVPVGCVETTEPGPTGVAGDGGYRIAHDRVPDGFIVPAPFTPRRGGPDFVDRHAALVPLADAAVTLGAASRLWAALGQDGPEAGGAPDDDVALAGAALAAARLYVHERARDDPTCEPAARQAARLAVEVAERVAALAEAVASPEDAAAVDVRALVAAARCPVCTEDAWRARGAPAGAGVSHRAGGATAGPRPG